MLSLHRIISLTIQWTFNIFIINVGEKRITVHLRNCTVLKKIIFEMQKKSIFFNQVIVLNCLLFWTTRTFTGFVILVSSIQKNNNSHEIQIKLKNKLYAYCFVKGSKLCNSKDIFVGRFGTFTLKIYWKFIHFKRKTQSFTIMFT